MRMIAVNAFESIQSSTPHCWPHLPQRAAAWRRRSCLCPLSLQLLTLSARHTWHQIFPQENKETQGAHVNFGRRKFSNQPDLLGITFERQTARLGRCHRVVVPFLVVVDVHEPQPRRVFATVFLSLWFNVGFKWSLLFVRLVLRRNLTTDYCLCLGKVV